MQTQYVTERRTIVTASRIGRPRKAPGSPKSPYTPRRETPKAPKATKPRGTQELLGGNGEMVLIDGCVPRAFADAMKALFASLA
jgi:hypothetical protein